MPGSAQGETDMKSAGMRKTAVVVTALLFLFAAGGCRKKEPPREAGGEAVNLNALSEIENYKEILRRDPNNLQALINIGNLYFDTRQDLLAIEHYQRSLSLDPRNVNVRTDMAVCFRRRGNPDKAIEELKKVISIDPRHPQSRYNLGVILIHDKNDIEGGIQAWEGLLENVPDYPYRDSLKTEITRMRTMVESMKPKTR
jgi:tetratricopeptide (TPR) repeat protein